MKEPAVRVLGPGVRYVLWVQGCDKHCPGCIAAQSHAADSGREIDVGALAWEIALSGAEGLTISGGEPSLQAPALTQLIRTVRAIRPMGVILYSGHLYEELLADSKTAALLAQVDLLIDGEYRQELNDGRGIRGSSNQRLIPLTPLYRQFVDQENGAQRRQEVFYHGPEVHTVGVPGITGKYDFPSKKERYS